MSNSEQDLPSEAMKNAVGNRQFYSWSTHCGYSFRWCSPQSTGRKATKILETQPSFISGADLELNLEQWIKPLQQSETYLSVGASLVNKNEKDEDILVGSTHRLNLPHNVSW